MLARPPNTPLPPTASADEADAVRLALLAGVLDATSIDDARQRLLATLPALLPIRWAALASWEQGSLVLSAHTASTDVRQIDHADELLGAMMEAVEQGVTLVAPGTGRESRLLFETTRLQALFGGQVAALPLAREGEILGALCLHTDASHPWQDEQLLSLEHQLSLAVPALRWMQRDAQSLWQRLVHRLRERWHDVQRPSRRLHRRVALGLGIVLAALTLLPLEREAGGPARLEADRQQVLAAPVDGFIQAAHARAGDQVAAGALLVELQEQPLQLERERWISQRLQHENAYAAAVGRGDRAQAAVAAARLEEAQAQLSLAESQLARTQLVAPEAALVIQGDLSGSIGAPVRQGDSLLTLAIGDTRRVVIEVDEFEIGRVKPGQTGGLRLSAWPWGSRAIVVERIVPMAHAVDGRNVFDVQARLVEADASLRPGQLGRARLSVGRSPLLWSWLQPLVDRIGLALWSAGA